jgi:N-acetyltransferase
MSLAPVTLEGRHVRLVPLSLEHVPALWEVADDEDLWRLTMATLRTRDDLRR